MASRYRRKLFVEKTVQGTLVSRVLIYWLFCLLSVSLMSMVWLIFTKQPETTSAEIFATMAYYMGPAFGASLIMLPLVVWDTLRISNRFAGPVGRLRRTMKQAAEDGRLTPLSFRDEDYWKDVSDAYNRLVERFEGCESTTSEAKSNQALVDV